MSERQLPNEEQVSRVLGALSEERSRQLAMGSRERTWRRIQTKWNAKAERRSSRVRWAALSSGWKLGLAAGALCAAVFGVLLLPSSDEPLLTFTLRHDTQPDGSAPALSTSPDGSWVQTHARSAALDFSDGSSVELSAHTVMNIDVLGEHSARARLSQGRLRVDVHHAERTNWSFFAGPYEVRVVGTAFDLAWDNSRLSLHMHEGEVRVHGPEQQHWVLKAGEQLQIPPAEPVVIPPADEPAALEAPADLIAVEEIATVEEITKPSRAPRQQSWSTWLAKGRFSEILEDARRFGLDRAMVSLPPSELAALAQAATYSGETRLAETTWVSIRSRHGGSASAAKGAFFLARLEERRGNGANAMRWLETYLSESPSGVYAAEAHGRRLVLARRLHGATSPRARESARHYLQRFPEGAYVETARATLGHR